MSYQKAVETAAELRRWPIGRGELHRWVAQEGARIEATSAADTEAVLGDRPVRERDGPRRGTVWVSADGTMVNDRSSGTEFEVKVPRKLTGVPLAHGDVTRGGPGCHTPRDRLQATIRLTVVPLAFARPLGGVRPPPAHPSPRSRQVVPRLRWDPPKHTS